MIKEKDNRTEKAILDAALKVFTEKGFAATRMDHIAKEAKINRALLHYYFRSKDKMFDLIFAQRINEFLSGIAQQMFSEKTLYEKIEAIVEHEINMLINHPHLPIFIFQELAQNPNRIVEHAKKAGAHPGELLKKFASQVKAEIKKGAIRNVEASHLLISIMSMAIYPFIAKPIIKGMLQLDDEEFKKLMRKRRQEVTEFIFKSLRP
ncbi:MAG TPA: TetR/AcrR family transcriptional regulator [Cyclobacteriaceae bacterium]|nr:TetR/AcrR family transcriptional regulator [Cyclobacteriaceae bacterium]